MWNTRTSMLPSHMHTFVQLGFCPLISKALCILRSNRQTWQDECASSIAVQIGTN